MSSDHTQIQPGGPFAAWAITIFVTFWVGIGCHRPEPRSDGPRLVSVSPGVTEIIEELGLGHQLVGISQYCEVVNSNARTIGSLYTLDTEVLLSLRPTHVFYQGNPGRFERLVDRHPKMHFAGFRLQTLDDVLLATKQIAQLTGHEARSAELTAGLMDRLHSIRVRALKQPKRTVAFVIPSGMGQYLLAAKGNFIDTLIDNARGVNVGAKLTGDDAWQTIPQEHLLSLGAELIIVHEKPIGSGSGDAPENQLRSFTEQPGVALKRVAVTQARYFTVPSMKLSGAAEEIFELIHPEVEPKR